MRFLNHLSIKAKNYLLVSLSVIVALTLSVVSYKGTYIIEDQVGELILVHDIEAKTYRTIIEE